MLLDLKLPKVDGLQVLQRNQATTRAPGQFRLSCSPRRKKSAIWSPAIECGVNSYIQKPVNFGEFQEVVRQLGMYWLLVNSKAPAAAFSAAVFPMNK